MDTIQELSPELIRDEARAFFGAYRDIRRPHHTSETQFVCYYAPALVCGTFSLELYLKCLRVLDGHPIKKGHDPSRLFAGLADSTQKRIADAWSRRLPNAPAMTPETVKAALEPLDGAFERWRYLFEHQTLAGSLALVDVALLAVQQTLAETRPDWFPAGTTELLDWRRDLMASVAFTQLPGSGR